jgi:hypothetical protein
VDAGARAGEATARTRHGLARRLSPARCCVVVGGAAVSAFCDRGSEVGRIIDETRAGEGGGGGSGRGRTLCARAAEALAAAEMEEAMARAVVRSTKHTDAAVQKWASTATAACGADGSPAQTCSNYNKTLFLLLDAQGPFLKQNKKKYPS